MFIVLLFFIRIGYPCIRRLRTDWIGFNGCDGRELHEENALQCKSQFIKIKSFKQYLDNSHARVTNLNDANRFLNILNKQHPKIQYTMEIENQLKTINFLDLTIMNNQTGKYEFKVHRKNVITKVKIKRNSSHDPKIITGELYVKF